MARESSFKRQFRLVYMRRCSRASSTPPEHSTAISSMEGASSLQRPLVRRSGALYCHQVYVRRYRRYVSSTGGHQSTLGHSTPIPTPVRRSPRVVMMKRKAATTVKNLQHSIQTKAGSEVLARRKLRFDSTESTRKNPPTLQHRRRASVSQHNDASCSTLAARVTPVSTPYKAVRTRRKPWKSPIRLKVDYGNPAPENQRKNGGGTEKKGKKRAHYNEETELAIVPHHCQNALDDPSSSAMVVAGLEDQRYRLQVDLDADTIRVYAALMQWEKTNSKSFDGVDIGSGPEWDQTRKDYESLVYHFIDTVRDCLLGHKQFSPCKGSVVDSVVGTFLTQNTADHLSSDAFMNLAAKYPGRKSHNSSENSSNNVPLLTYEGKCNLNLNEASDVTDFDGSAFAESVNSDEEINYGDGVKGHHDKDYEIFMENFVNSMKTKDPSIWTEKYLVNLMKDQPGSKKCSLETLRRLIATLRVEDTSRWDKLRKKACKKGYQSGTGISDLVDWDAVLNAPPAEVARYIAVRGMNYVMACRIQAFLLRTKNNHGNFDLDWLRHVPPEKAKNYITSIRGLGPKSADCIRLLSLGHIAFPVDVNICRICVRLGWVKLQGLPDSVAFHLIDLYPILSDVQKFLWARLCTILKAKLYELHCLMITFGKVVCTKVDPNCEVCPFSQKCKYYSSLHNSASLPPTKKHMHEPGEDETSVATSSNFSTLNSLQVCPLQIDLGRTTENPPIWNSVPIIEEPPSPVYEHVEEFDERDDLCDIEDFFRSQESEYDAVIDLCSHKENHGKDMVCNTLYNFVQQEKPKNIGLRTEHEGYVLPDGHIILNKFENRHKEDPHHHLLVISSTDEHTVKCTVLIPFRTAMRGKFPLKGTYFQDHEVFADYWSSRYPISIPRGFLGELPRCTVYFGSSIQSIMKDMTAPDIQKCFSKGAVCIRCIDRRTGYPRTLCTSLHATNGTKDSVGSYRKKTKTSSRGKDEPPVGHTPAAAAETEEAGSSDREWRTKRARRLATVPVPDAAGSDGGPSGDTRALVEEHEVPAGSQLGVNHTSPAAAPTTVFYFRRRPRSTGEQAKPEDHKTGPDN